jgi:hypothetical protein
MEARMLRVQAVGLVVLIASATPPVRAEEPVEGASPAPLSGAEVTLAETLYREGRKLMADQRYAEACAKFAESHRLDPATGTLLNLATCHEAQGKLASSWLAFSEALRAARREQREDRVRYAEERIAQLEPRLSHLTIAVTRAPALEGMVVRVDGFLIGPAAYGVAAPIDPGTHRVEASAPGHETWSAEVVVGGGADRQLVTVPALKPLPVAEPPQPVPPTPRRVTPQASESDAGAPASRPIPTAVYAAGAATLVLTGAAVVTAITYLNRKSDYGAIRDDPGSSHEQRQSAREEARGMGWINVGLSAGALLGAGVTVVLYSTRPEQRRSGGVPRLRAWALPKQGGLTLTSEF